MYINNKIFTSLGIKIYEISDFCSNTFAKSSMMCNETFLKVLEKKFDICI